jgi:hypothetical protein
VTHVLLTVSCLLRRADAVEVIGAALRMKATGAGHRPIATRLARPASTVRGWLRAFMCNAEMVRSVFTALLVQLDPLSGRLPSHPSGSPMPLRRSVRVLRRAAAVWACSARCRRGSWLPRSRTAASLLRAVPQS